MKFVLAAKKVVLKQTVVCHASLHRLALYEPIADSLPNSCSCLYVETDRRLFVCVSARSPFHAAVGPGREEASQADHAAGLVRVTGQKVLR